MIGRDFAAALFARDAAILIGIGMCVAAAGWGLLYGLAWVVRHVAITII